MIKRTHPKKFNLEVNARNKRNRNSNFSNRNLPPPPMSDIYNDRDRNAVVENAINRICRRIDTIMDRAIDSITCVQTVFVGDDGRNTIKRELRRACSALIEIDQIDNRTCTALVEHIESVLWALRAKHNNTSPGSYRPITQIHLGMIGRRNANPGELPLAM